MLGWFTHRILFDLPPNNHYSSLQWVTLVAGEWQSNLMQLRLLRLFLGFSAFAWGISAVGVFASWAEADRLLEGLGAKPIPYDPMLDYWLRMAAGAFALVGAWYLLLAIWPQKFRVAIPWFGFLMVLEGVILLVHGLRLSLPPFPFYGDVSACFVGGAGILLSLPGLPEGAGDNSPPKK